MNIITATKQEIEMIAITDRLYEIASKYASFFECEEHELIAKYSFNKDGLTEDRFSTQEKHKKFLEFAEEIKQPFEKHIELTA